MGINARALPPSVRRLIPGRDSAPKPKRRIAQNGRSYPRDGRATLLASLSEKEFQALVVEGLRSRGYHVWIVPDMRMTTAGLPDLLFFHPRRPGRLFAWELKTTRGKTSPDQDIALAHLETVAGIDARVLRPGDWDRLKERM